jgi:collagen type III alpha
MLPPPSPPSPAKDQNKDNKGPTNRLDEFVEVGWFRGDGDLNFERDFGQWFNPDDVRMTLGNDGQWFNPDDVGMKLGNDDESDDDDEVNFHPDVNANALNTVEMPLPLWPPGSTENLFSPEFIQSVREGLEEFVDVGLFRGDGDLNFERDFSQWFNPNDVGLELGKP